MTTIKHTNYYCVVLDESGSMYSHASDTTGSLQQFFDAQKNISNDHSIFQINTFNHECKTRWTGSISEKLTYDYNPTGNTALYDAICQSIENTRQTVDILTRVSGSKPEFIYVIILTDGYENASTKYNRDTTKALIQTMTNEHKWNFVYLGANQDSFQTGGSLGIQPESCLDFAQNSSATPAAMRSVSQAIYRQNATPGGASLGFTDLERNISKHT